MSTNTESENRSLSASELEMVGGTQSPAIEQQSKEQLKVLLHRLRQAHSRANDISARQRRELRGKADPHGVKRVQDNSGSVAKAQLLFEAIQRVDKELSRRERDESAS